MIHAGLFISSEMPLRVGGLTLGGGISHSAPRYGWTYDMVSTLKGVLVDGSVEEANDMQNKDLFPGPHGESIGVVTHKH
ncbi:hypothetical protein NHQ30_001972 [Ciborinia camelliae]|nr:hypothetical protein NHQ30_001972 [Ciborinia camelliae]